MRNRSKPTLGCQSCPSTFSRSLRASEEAVRHDCGAKGGIGMDRIFGLLGVPLLVTPFATRLFARADF